MKNILNKIGITALSILLNGTSYICQAQTTDTGFSVSLPGLGTTVGFGSIFLLALGATAILVAIVTVVITIKVRRNMCPFCKSQMRKSGFETTQISRNAILHTTIYTCSGCGNVRTRTHKINYHPGKAETGNYQHQTDNEKHKPHTPVKNGERKHSR